MRISTLYLSFLVVCVGAAAVQPLPAHQPSPAGDSIAHQLGKRQISIGSVSSAPSQCSSSCSPVNDEINLGCPPTACCTTTFETQYYNCLECIGTAADNGNYSTLQPSLNLLYTTCVDLGFVLPRMELPGQPSNGSNSSTSATATGLGSSPSTSAGGTSTGAAVSDRPHAMQVEALIGISTLLLVAALW